MSKNVGKAEWVDMFKAIGLSEEQMKQWHRLFETTYPDDHLSFLKWLGLADEEAAGIRKASR